MVKFQLFLLLFQILRYNNRYNSSFSTWRSPTKPFCVKLNPFLGKTLPQKRREAMGDMDDVAAVTKPILIFFFPYHRRYIYAYGSSHTRAHTHVHTYTHTHTQYMPSHRAVNRCLRFSPHSLVPLTECP